MPAPLSRSTCHTSSLVLEMVLHGTGFEAQVCQGTDPDADEGDLFEGVWHGHAWVRVSSHIIDIAGDQIDLLPVAIQTAASPRYRSGLDTAHPDA